MLEYGVLQQIQTQDGSTVNQLILSNPNRNVMLYQLIRFLIHQHRHNHRHSLNLSHNHNHSCCQSRHRDPRLLLEQLALLRRCHPRLKAFNVQNPRQMQIARRKDAQTLKMFAQMWTLQAPKRRSACPMNNAVDIRRRLEIKEEVALKRQNAQWD